MHNAQTDNPVMQAIEITKAIAAPWRPTDTSGLSGSRNRNWNREELFCAFSRFGLDLRVKGWLPALDERILEQVGQQVENKRTFTVAATLGGGYRRKLPLET